MEVIDTIGGAENVASATAAKIGNAIRANPIMIVGALVAIIVVMLIYNFSKGSHKQKKSSKDVDTNVGEEDIDKLISSIESKQDDNTGGR